MATTVTTHRQPLEYLGGVRRFPVPEDKIPWSVDYPGYHPVDYTAPRVLSRPVWADPDIRKEEPEKPMQFNSLDGKVDRRSHTGTYQIVDKVPRYHHSHSILSPGGKIYGGKLPPPHTHTPL
jgi:ADP-ribose pyrophosphatase